MADSGGTEDLALRMRKAGARTQTNRADLFVPEGDGGFPLRAVVPVFLAVAGAFYAASVAGVHGGLPVHFPSWIDKRVGLWLSPHPPSTFGGPADAALAAGAQAVAVCLAAAVFPVIVVLWRRLRDNARGKIYISFWGMSVGLPFTVVLLKDFLWPILRDMASGF